MVCVGNEKFICNGSELDMTVLDFWRFTYSDLNSDPRDYLAEFLVSKAPGINNPYNKEVWTLFDILYGNTRVEVKCTGYFQTWRTDGKVCQSRYYSIKPAHDKIKCYLTCDLRKKNSGFNNFVRFYSIYRLYLEIILWYITYVLFFNWSN